MDSEVIELTAEIAVSHVAMTGMPGLFRAAERHG